MEHLEWKKRGKNKDEKIKDYLDRFWAYYEINDTLCCIFYKHDDHRVLMLTLRPQQLLLLLLIKNFHFRQAQVQMISPAPRCEEIRLKYSLFYNHRDQDDEAT